MAVPLPASDVAEAIFAVMRVMRPRVDAVMSAHGLSLSRAKVLSTIQRVGSCRPGVIAAQLGFSPRSLTDSVDGLERDGLVARQPDPSDRRAQLLVLTQAGHAALASVEEPRRALIEQIFSCLDDGEKQALAQMLRRVEAAHQEGSGQ